MRITPSILTGGLLAALSLAACGNTPDATLDAHKPAAVGVKVDAALPPASTPQPPAPPPSPTPPPYAPVREVNDEPLVPVIVAPDPPALRRALSREELAREEEETYVYYRWVDDSGTIHTTDTLSAVPESMRGRVTTTPRSKPRPTPDFGAPVAQGIDSDALDKAKAKREQACKDYGAKVKAALQAQQSAEEALQLEENSPPDCGAQAKPGYSTTYDLNCDEHWQARLALKRKQAAAARQAVETLRTDARRAGVPPGCLR